jgi:hypothetical protein
MNVIEAWKNLEEKFTSGNNIPVERNTITIDEYQAIKTERDEMLDALLGNYETYEVLKEIFENINPALWRMITGAYSDEPLKIINIIERATGMTIEEAIKAREGKW